MAIKKRSATVVHGASGAAAAVKNPHASKSSFWGELPQQDDCLLTTVKFDRDIC